MPIILLYSPAVTFAFWRCCIVSYIVARANCIGRLSLEHASDNARE